MWALVGLRALLSKYSGLEGVLYKFTERINDLMTSLINPYPSLPSNTIPYLSHHTLPSITILHLLLPYVTFHYHAVSSLLPSLTTHLTFPCQMLPSLSMLPSLTTYLTFPHHTILSIHTLPSLTIPHLHLPCHLPYLLPSLTIPYLLPAKETKRIENLPLRFRSDICMLKGRNSIDETIFVPSLRSWKRSFNWKRRTVP